MLRFSLQFEGDTFRPICFPDSYRSRPFAEDEIAAISIAAASEITIVRRPGIATSHPKQATLANRQIWRDVQLAPLHTNPSQGRASRFISPRWRDRLGDADHPAIRAGAALLLREGSYHVDRNR